MRERYEQLMRDPGKIEDTLLEGAAKARALSAPFMARLRHAVGLRSLRTQAAAQSSTKPGKAALPSFKQYRDSDGQFYFKFVDAQGKLLLQSQAFASPKDAGAAIGRLQTEGVAALHAFKASLQPVDGASPAEVHAALDHLQAAKAA